MKGRRLKVAIGGTVSSTPLSRIGGSKSGGTLVCISGYGFGLYIPLHLEFRKHWKTVPALVETRCFLVQKSECQETEAHKQTKQNQKVPPNIIHFGTNIVYHLITQIDLSTWV